MATADAHSLENLEPSWKAALSSEFSKPYWSELNSLLASNKEVRSHMVHFLNAFKRCAIERVNVVIVGKGADEETFQCIFKGAVQVITWKSPTSPELDAEPEIQFTLPVGPYDLGVLLLNAAMTMEENSRDSEDGILQKFTTAVLGAISERCTGVVFMLWGADSQAMESCVDKEKHHVLRAELPSSPGFLGCRHFSQCNELLKSQGKPCVNWQVPQKRQYMIIEHLNDPKPVYARFKEKGRMFPEGLSYVNSWITEDLLTCYQVMECSDRSLLDEWISHWSDLVDFDVIPVVSTAQASKAAE